MVRVSDYKERQSKDGEKFYVLVLQSGVFPVKSKKTGRMYFTAKTCTAPSTFDEEMCKELIGSQFPGQIVKVEVDPYEYVIPETGEVVLLEHRWEYQDDMEEIVTSNIIEASEVM